MAFDICFTGDPDEYLDDDLTIPTAIGRITAGNLNEEFASSVASHADRLLLSVA